MIGETILHYKILEKLGEPACRRQGRACPPKPSKIIN
jgi:hypothetical protein